MYKLSVNMKVLSMFSAFALIGAIAVFGQSIVLDPYAEVNWQTFEQHKANLHTHTTQSDGQLTPSQAIDEYRSRGYTILSLTDHNLCTWSWTDLAEMERKGRALQSDNAAAKEPDVPSEERRFPRVYAYEDRVPEEVGMVAIAGNEYSIHQHANSYFVQHENRSRKIEQTINEVGDLGGIMVINHPGRYWDLTDTGSIPEDVIARYVGLYRNNPHVIGMEVINQGKRYKDDVRLWDEVLTALMPERPVWGFSNDDMHVLKKLGRDWDVFLLTSLDGTQVRSAMETGQFYFCTTGTHPEETRSVQETPIITAISHDVIAGILKINASSGDVLLPDEDYKWISQGNVVHTGSTIHYRTIEGIDKYLRAELTGKGGTTYTNPYGIRK